MKSSRFLCLLLSVILLLISLSSCSERGNTGQQDPTPAETEPTAADNAAPQEDTATDAPASQQSAGQQQPASEDTPYQVDYTLAWHAVLDFGAPYANNVMRTGVVSLYSHDRWTIDDADGTDFFSWYVGIGSQLHSEEEQEELFRAEDGSWAYPAEIYEADVRRYFDATTEQMRDNPDLYHADTNTYYALAGPGVGERPSPAIQSFEQEGDLVNIRLYLEGEIEQDRWMMLTVRLTEDGYRYVSYLPQSVNRAITGHLLEEIILKFGAEVTRSDHVYHSTGSGMFLSPSWTVEEMTPGSFNGWYLDYSNYIYTYGERLTIFASPLGENTGWFYPADLYEAAAKAYFGLSAEELRAGENYNEEYGGYFSPHPVGRGYTPLITLEDYDQQYDLLTLNLSVSQLEAPDRKMALTVRLTEDGYQYLSYLPR